MQSLVPACWHSPLTFANGFTGFLGTATGGGMVDEVDKDELMNMAVANLLFVGAEESHQSQIKSHNPSVEDIQVRLVHLLHIH